MIFQSILALLMKRGQILILFVTSTLVTITLMQLSKHGVKPLSNNAIYGPFRWWNTEVVPIHTLAIIDSYSTPEAPKSIFAPSMPSNTSMGYFSRSTGSNVLGGIDAGIPLRFVEGGSAYGSFPPLAFVLTWCFSLLFKSIGLANNTIKSLDQVNILVFILTSFNLSLAAIKILEKIKLKNLANQIIIIAITNLIILTSPISFYMLAVNQLWVHQWLLLFISLAILSLFLPEKAEKYILLSLIFIFPFLSYTAIPIQASILFIIVRKKYFSKIVNLILFVLPNLLVSFWVIFAFDDVKLWLSTVLSRSQSRRFVENSTGDETLFNISSLLSLLESIGWSYFGTLVFLVIIFISSAHHWKNKYRDYKNDNFCFIWIIILASLLEIIFIPGHAYIYSFAQVPIIIALWFSFIILFIKYYTWTKMSTRQSSMTWIVFASILLILNYSTLVIIYDSGRSYDVVTGEGL
jgi:hypothetical protein